MAELREWLIANRPIITFVYGQVFFVMGIAIVLQSRRYSRLELARSLPWLAAFGITHGLNEWGDLFLPIQAQFLPDPFFHFLRALESVLLAGSFACLMRFGIGLLQPRPARWIQWLPFGVLLLWGSGPFWLGLQLAPDLDTWHVTVDALARYFIGFPGGLLAAYSLRRYAQLRIAPLNLPHIYNTLRVAGLALAAYAVVSGLIVRTAPFFPANVFNSNWVSDNLIVPPQVLRSIAGLVLAIAIIRALEVFEVETDRLIAQMEEAQVAAIERERLGRDLHDGAIQRVYAAGLLAEALRKKADGPLGEGLDRLMSALNEAIADLRHFISGLRTDVNATDLAAVLSTVVDEARQTSGLDVRWSPTDLPLLPPDRASHLVAFLREALSNAVRHAHAHVIEVTAHCNAQRLELQVRDNGRGFESDTPRGYGVRNMRDRARLLGGEVTITSARGKGTQVTLIIPMERDV